MTTNETGVRSLVQTQIIIICMKYSLQATITNMVTKRVFDVMSDTF